ncbi:MAG: hypothetical protein HZB57_06360 [Gammaproteobacteria bacterium]|nr:hypothetical protein [Gammaproteobacteria bacterium]
MKTASITFLKSAFVFLVISLGSFLFGTASATCTQANLTGTWYAMGVSGDTYWDEMTETDRCKVVISSTGAVTSGSSCNIRDQRGLYTLRIASGTMHVTTACAVSGSLRLCGNSACTVSAIFTIQYGQMTRDKESFPLLGYKSADPDVVFIYEAVKQ